MSERNPMRGILIDPVAQTVAAVTLLNGELDTIYALIEAEPIDVRPVTERDDLWIDDEALLRRPAPTCYAQWGDYAHPIAGKQLILGHNDEGDCISTQLSVERVERAVRFTRREFRGIREEPERRIVHPVLGPATLHRRVAEFGPEGES